MTAPQLTFHQSYKGGRILAKSAQIDVGAIFPPSDTDSARAQWRWMLWLNGKTIATEGNAKTELGARNAVATGWSDFLNRAGLLGMTDA